MTTASRGAESLGGGNRVEGRGATRLRTRRRVERVEAGCETKGVREAGRGSRTRRACTVGVREKRVLLLTARAPRQGSSLSFRPERRMREKNPDLVRWPPRRVSRARDGSSTAPRVAYTRATWSRADDPAVLPTVERRGARRGVRSLARVVRVTRRAARAAWHGRSERGGSDRNRAARAGRECATASRRARATRVGHGGGGARADRLGGGRTQQRGGSHGAATRLAALRSERDSPMTCCRPREESEIFVPALFQLSERAALDWLERHLRAYAIGVPHLHTLAAVLRRVCLIAFRPTRHLLLAASPPTRTNASLSTEGILQRRSSTTHGRGVSPPASRDGGEKFGTRCPPSRPRRQLACKAISPALNRNAILDSSRNAIS